MHHLNEIVKERSIIVFILNYLNCSETTISKSEAYKSLSNSLKGLFSLLGELIVRFIFLILNTADSELELIVLSRQHLICIDCILFNKQ